MRWSFHSTGRSVIGLEGFSVAVPDEHVVPVLSVEGRTQADDSVIYFHQAACDVIAVSGCGRMSVMSDSLPNRPVRLGPGGQRGQASAREN